MYSTSSPWLCPASPAHVRARPYLLCLCMSGAGVAFPMQILSSSCHSSSKLRFSSALPGNPVPMLCKSVPIRRVAVPGQAWRFPCKSWHIYALAAQGFAFPARCGYKHCRSHAAYCISHASRIQTSPRSSHAWRCHSGAERRAAIPVHAIALHCPALPSLSERCHCHVLLCPSAAWLCRCVSKHSLFGAYPLGPLPAPFSPW